MNFDDLIPDDVVDQNPQEAKAGEGFKQLLSSGKGTTQQAPMEGVEPEGDPLTDLAGGYLGAKLGTGAAEILGNEIGAVGRSVKKAAAPKALPMDEASRLARAAKDGFNTSKTYYHGTKGVKDIESFNLAAKSAGGEEEPLGAIFVTDDPSFANKFTGGSREGTSKIYPVHIKAKNTFDYQNPSHVSKIWKNVPDELIETLQDEFPLVNGKPITKNALKQQFEMGSYGIIEKPEIQDAIKSAGFDSFHVYENGKKNTGLYNTNQIRSKFAEFNPKQAKSGKLSYANGGEIGDFDSLVADPNNQQPSDFNQTEMMFDDLKSDEQVKHEKYSTPSQYLKTFGEAAGRGLVGPLAPLAERAAGVDPEEILARQEENPVTSFVGEVAGLTVPAILTAGESLAGRAAARFTQAGVLEAIGKKVGMKAGDTLASKIGVGAAKGALDNILIAGSDEISRKVINDPHQSASSAMYTIGLSAGLGAILGGGIGSASGLFKSTVADKASQEITNFADRLKHHMTDADPMATLTREFEGLHTQTKAIRQAAKEAEFMATEAKAAGPEMLAQNIPLKKDAPLAFNVEKRALKIIAKAEEEFQPHLERFEENFTTKTPEGDTIVDPNAIFSYFDKLKPGAHTPKQGMALQFIEANEKYRKAVNNAYSELGQPEPITATSTNAISASLAEQTMGSKWADKFVKEGMEKMSGKAIGATIGGALGHATSIPYAGTLGAIVGGHALGSMFESVFPAIAKKLMSNPASATGFKAAAEFVAAVAKGESMLNKASKNVFRVGSDVLGESMFPSQRERDKLHKQLSELQNDPNKAFSAVNHTGHYLPDHASAMDQSIIEAATYLNSIRASQDKKAPLDSKPVLSNMQKAEYNNALDIAQQPLIILDKLKKGTLTQKDISALGSMYPQLYINMQQKLSAQMIETVNKNQPIPYKTRIGLSMFMGQALDSTMTPEALTATQGHMAQAQTQKQQESPKGTKSSPALQKMPNMYQTSSQSREQRKNK